MTHLPAQAPAPSRPPRPAVRAARAACVAVLAVPLLVSGGAANAATRVFDDPDDSRGIDIRRVRVSYDDWLRVRVKHDGRVDAGQLYAFWIDTRRRNPGPEYHAAFRPNAEVPPLERVSGFRDPTKTPTACEDIDARADIVRPRADVTFRVAGSCLGDPNRVRISVHFVKSNGSSADWAPAPRRVYPSVRRS